MKSLNYTVIGELLYGDWLVTFYRYGDGKYGSHITPPASGDEELENDDLYLGPNNVFYSEEPEQGFVCKTLLRVVRESINWCEKNPVDYEPCGSPTHSTFRQRLSVIFRR